MLRFLIYDTLRYEKFSSEFLSTNVEKTVFLRERRRTLNWYGFKNVKSANIPRHYLKENKNLCFFPSKINVLFMIESLPSHFDRRKAIRETWANEKQFSSSFAIKLLFLFGRLKNTTLQKFLDDEFRLHNDILQGDFVDSYRNLSLSTIMGIAWINTNCRKAEFVVKVDDDIVVNTFALEERIREEYVSKHNQVTCFRSRGQPVQRSLKSKHFVDYSLFKNMKYYPTFCEGKFVLMTRDVIPMLLESISFTPYFWIEDVYVHGLVMNSVPNIEFNGISWKRQIEIRHNVAKRCLQRNIFTCSFFVVGAYSGQEIREIWKLMRMHKPRISKYMFQYILLFEQFYAFS